MNYRETDDDCDGCGSTARDRLKNKSIAPPGLGECPYCGNSKCCLCDMGDDVECPNCDNRDWGDGEE